MGDYSFSLWPLVWIGVLTGIIIVGLVWFSFWLGSDDSIRVDKPITPTIELVVKDGNKIDTVYVYKRP